MDTAQTKKGTPIVVDPGASQRADRRALWRLRRSYGGDDVQFLNITAMMDMMTILLVFMLKTLSSQSSNVTLSDQLSLPLSGTADQFQESVSVTITRSSILVEGDPIVGVKRGVVDSSDKAGGDANALIITPLSVNLKKRSTYYKLLAKAKGQRFEGALTLIVDKSTTYRLLTEVMYTAGDAEYRMYRLIVLNKDVKTK